MKLGNFFFVSNIYQVEANLKVAYSSFLIAVIMPLLLFSILILEDYILDCLNSILSTLLSLCFLIIIAYSIRYSLIYLQ